jgi:predicted DNA-binding transcriptional regulator YafY
MKQFLIISIVLVISYIQIAYSVENSSESFSISSASIERDLDKLRGDRVDSESNADSSENNAVKQKRGRRNNFS